MNLATLSISSDDIGMNIIIMGQAHSNMVTTKTTLLSTNYKRTTELIGTLLNVFHSVQTTSNDLL